MQRYLLERSVQLVIVLFFLSVIVFTIVRLIPGDPAAIMLGTEATPQVMAQIRREMGLDQPIVVQYVRWLRSVLAGNFGTSWVSKQPALGLILGALPVTLQLVASAFVVALVIAFPAGIVAALRPRSWIDHGSTTFALLGVSLPSFWLGIMLVLLFGVTLRWLPTSGYQNWTYLILPSITLAAYPTALVARLTRSSMLEILSRDYIRTGRAKGLAERAVILRHALRNATIPVLTVIGIQIGALLGGAVITESVFAWPGMGKLVVDAIYSRDFPVVQTVLIISATIFVAINLLVDALYTVVDPRIRYR